MKKHTLSAEPRTQVGKTVKLLRKHGKLPATIYGNGLKSQSVTVDTAAFAIVRKEAGETGLIELSVSGKVHPVLIHSVQVHPVTDSLIHVEFHQVNLKEKIHAKVMLEHTGESPAAAQKLGVVMTLHDSIEVEALPTELPEKLHIDLSGLAEVGQDITAANVALPSGVTLITDSTTVLVKVGPLVTKEAEAEVAADAAQAAEAAASAETVATENAGEVKKETSEKTS